MTNLFEKFVTADAATLHAEFGSKRTGDLASPDLDAKSKVSANAPPFCVESGVNAKNASGSSRPRENILFGKVDIGPKKKTAVDPRLVKRHTNKEPPPPPPPPRRKSNSPSSSPQNSSSPPPQQTYSKRSMHGFTIPKRTDNKLIRDVDLKSREFLNEILPLLKQSFRFPSSATKLTVTGAQLVRNSNLERKYQQKKQELASEGRAEKELADCYAFLGVKDEELARKICQEGVRVGNVPFTSLGKPKMGVCLQKHADILSYKFPDGTTNMIIFKTVKGRVKAVPENSVNLEPTPNHDYHVSKNTSLRPTETDIKRLCSATQIYAYEYGDDGVVQRPRHLCPVAILQYRYGDASPHKLTSKQSSSSKTATIRSSLTRGTQVWTGQLFNDETFLSDVRLISYSILFRPTHITTTIVLTHTIPMSEFKQRYLVNCAHISKTREMHIGRNFLLYMQLHSSEIHSFDQMVNFLDQNNEAGVWYCGQRVECFLLPHTSKSTEMGFPALTNRKQMCHCLFVSPYSLASRLAAERGRLAKKAIVAVQKMHDVFGGSAQVEGSMEFQASMFLALSLTPASGQSVVVFNGRGKRMPDNTIFQMPNGKCKWVEPGKWPYDQSFPPEVLSVREDCNGTLIKEAAKGFELASVLLTGQNSSYSFYASPHSPHSDFDQPFYTVSPATSLLKAPVIKAAFEQQALGEDSLLLDKAPKPSNKSNKSAETSSLFQSSKHFSAYRSTQADNVSSGVPPATNVLYSPTETLAMLQGGDTTPPATSAAAPTVSSTTDRYRPSVTGGQHPVLSSDALAEIQAGLYTQNSRPVQSAPKKRQSSGDRVSGTGRASPRYCSDDSSHSSHFSATRRSGSGSSVPYSPTQFSPYEEESQAEDHVTSTDITQLHKIKFLTIPNCEKNFSGTDPKTSARTRPAVTKRARTDAVTSSADGHQSAVDSILAHAQSVSSRVQAASASVKNTLPVTSAGMDSTFMAARTDAAAVSAVKQQKTVAPANDVRKDEAVKKTAPSAPAKPAVIVPPAVASQNSSQNDPRALAKKSKLLQASQSQDAPTVDKKIQLGKRKSDGGAEQPVEVTLIEGLEGKRRKPSPHPIKEIPLECSVTAVTDPRIQKTVAQPEVVTATEATPAEASQVPVAVSRKDGDTSSINLADPSLLKEVLANPTVQEALAKFQEDEIKMLNACLKVPNDLQNVMRNSSEDQASVGQVSGIGKDSDVVSSGNNKQVSAAITTAGHINQLSSFATTFQQTQCNETTNESTDKLKVEVIRFTEDIMKKINHKAASTLQAGEKPRGRHHRKPPIEDKESRCAMELSEISTDDMLTLDEEFDMEAAEDMSKRHRSSRHANSMDEALAEDIDEALALEELEPLSLGMDDMFDTEGSGDGELPRHMGRRSWKLDTVSSNNYELEMFSDISLDEQDVIRKSLLGEDLADQEKRMRSEVARLLYPDLEEACQTDKTLMDEMKQFYSNMCELLHGGICHEISCYQDKLNVNNICMALAPIMTEKLTDRLHRRSSADKTLDAIVNAEREKFAELVEQQFSKPALTALVDDIESLDFCGDGFVEKRNSVFQKAVNDMLERYGFDKDELKAMDTNGKPQPKTMNLLSALCKPNLSVDGITSEKRKELSAKLEDLVKKMERVRTPTPTPTPTPITPTPAAILSDHDEGNTSGSGDDALEEILKLQKQGDTPPTRLIQKSKPITFSLKPSSRWSSSKPPVPVAPGIDLTHIPLPEECQDDSVAQEDMEAYSPSSETLNMANFVASQAGKTNSLTESPSEVAKESLMAKRLQRARKLISAYSLTAPKTAPSLPDDPAELRKKKLRQRRHRVTTQGPKILVNKKVACVKRMLRLQRLQKSLNNSLQLQGGLTTPLRSTYLDFRQKLLQYYKLQHAKRQESAKKADHSNKSSVSSGKLRVPIRQILAQVGRLVKTFSNADNEQLQSLLVLHGYKFGKLVQDAGRKLQLFATKKAKISLKKPKKPTKKTSVAKKIATAKRTEPLPKISPKSDKLIAEDAVEKTVDTNAILTPDDNVVAAVPPTPLVPYGRESPDHMQEDSLVVPRIPSPVPPAFDISGQEPYWPENPTGTEDLLDIPTPAGSSLDFIQRDYTDMPFEEATVEDSTAVFEDVGNDFNRNAPPVSMLTSLEQEPVDVTTTQVNGGYYFIFGYHDESCNEAKEFLESDGHRRFDFNDPVSLHEVEQGAPLWIFVHASVLPKIYLLPRLVQLKHFSNSHFLMFDIPRQLPERSCTDLMVSGGIIIPDASILLKSPPGILTHLFGLMRKKREMEGPWRMLIHDHILLQLEKLRGAHELQEHNTTTARAFATLKILITHHKEELAHFMYPHACDIESRTQLMCAKKVQEQHFNTHRHIIIVTDADPERMTEYVQNGTTVVSMIQLINTYLL